MVQIIGTGTPINWRVPLNNDFYALGDSRIEDNKRSVTYTNVGGVSQFRDLSLGRMQMELANINGVGGATSTDIRTLQYPTAVASGLTNLAYLGFVNDCFPGSGVDLAQSISNADFFCADWTGLSANHCIFIANEQPWDTALWPTGDQAHLLGIHEYIDTLHNPSAGIYVWNTWKSATGSQSAWTPYSDQYRDGIHDAIPGAVRNGKALYNVANGILPPNTFFSRPITIGGDFTGVGAAPTGPDGAWTVPSGAGITTEMVVDDGLNWLRITMVDVLGQLLTFPTSAVIPPGFVPGGNIRSSIRYRLEEGSANIRRLGLEMRIQGGGVVKLASDGINPAIDITDMGSGSDAVTLAYPSNEFIDAVAYTPLGVLPGLTSQLRPWVFVIQSRTTLPMSGVLWLALPQSEAI